MMDNKIYICLANGDIFEGKSFGAKGEVTGELVFTTGMGGYIETLTDPSYFGQIVMQTFPLIGNYGFIDDDMECEKSAVKAYIVREYCDAPSNFRCGKTLEQYLTENNIVGVYDVDTREITKKIREVGTLKAVMSDTIDNKDDIVKMLKETPYMNDHVKRVSTKNAFPIPNRGKKVVLIDFGAKLGIIRELSKRDCDLVVVPYDTDYKTIMSLNPDGIMLSNGPGDPKDVKESINTIRELIGKVPIFGICLGHQLISLACGANTIKLKFGHRGGNHPVKDLETSKGA